MPGSEEKKLAWKRSQPANYTHWNRFPLLDFDQCLMLLLGIEPRTRIKERSIQDRYNRLWKLIQSSQSAGTLVGRYPYHQDIEPSKFIEWAESIGEPIPEGWKPFDTAPAVKKEGEAQVTDEAIIDAFADDIYKRMSIKRSDDMHKVGGQKIYDFLLSEGSSELPTEYKLSVMSYWLVDEKKDVRVPYEVGSKVDLALIKIQYKKRDADDHGSVPFRKLLIAFKKVKVKTV